MNLKYNIFLDNQIKKKISQIRQINKLIAYIIIFTDVKLKQKIKKRHDKYYQV